MSVLDRVKGSLQFRLDRAADRVAATLADQLHRDMQDVVRILRQQGDAADEVAETFGRTLVRLSADIDRLTAALDRRATEWGPAAE